MHFLVPLKSLHTNAPQQSLLLEHLARLRPVLAVVSSGAGNHYGHPRAQVLAALADAGAGVLRTDLGGDVDLRAGQGGIVVRRG